MGIQFDGINNRVTTSDIVSQTGTFSSDVGIGGTLTYEDVANIDSVGVITAKNGINVTSGNLIIGSTSAEAKLDVTGGVSISSNGVTVSPSGYDLKIRSNTGKLGVHIDNASGTPTLEFGIGGATGADITTNSTGPIVFKPNNSERLRITHNGEIGIGGANYGTSGQFLQSQGSGSAVQWATPSSGLSHAQQWYLTANGSTPNGGTDYVLPTDAGTWQKHSAAVSARAGTLGSDMTYSGSGIFTFPVTGIWKIEFQGWWGISASDSDHYLRSRIQTTINNSSYTTNQEQANSVKSDSTYTYQGFYVSTLFDVTDTSNCKVRFVLNPSGSNTYYKADGSPPKTGALFMRLGDT